MSTKLDIFETIGKVTSRQFDWFSSLTPQEQKAFAPVVVMRWLSGSKSADQIELINEFVNTKVFPLYQHPDLLYRLMVSTNVDKGRRSWIAKGKAKTNKPHVSKLLSLYYKCSVSQAAEYADLIDTNQILDIASFCGYQADEIKKINDEIKRTTAQKIVRVQILR